ncbi:MAG: hypothetical protein NDF51_00430 [archaeon YNP-WB-040]|nr:hypothetical protein [Candidatus Culexarchaeum yellowstonense]
MNGKYLWLILPLVAALLVAPVIADNISVTVAVPAYFSVVFNYDTVNFGKLSAAEVTDLAAPGQDYGIYNVTVTSNVPMNVIAYRSPWTPMDILILKFADALSPSDFAFVDKYVLETTPKVIRRFEGAGTFVDYHGYWLTVPLTAPQGEYSTTVTITYQPA